VAFAKQSKEIFHIGPVDYITAIFRMIDLSE